MACVLRKLIPLLDGDLMHQDTGGYKSIIKKDGVQWMRAGSGLIHNEVMTARCYLYSVSILYVCFKFFFSRILPNLGQSWPKFEVVLAKKKNLKRTNNSYYIHLSINSLFT